MYAMKEEDYFQNYQDQYLLHHHQQQQQQIFPWFDPTRLDRNPNPNPGYGSFFSDGLGSSTHHHHHPTSMEYYNQHESHLRILSEALGPVIRPGFGLDRFGMESEMGKMSAQDIMDAKALAASKSHSEAERRRRERINNHLAKLRSILPNTTKTDKASLLAEVIQHVKELKRQTSLIYETSPVPTETDELTVDVSAEEEDYHDGSFVIKATLCCQDRPDLMSDVINVIKSLRLKTLKAELTTLGGRVKNILFITREENQNLTRSNNGGEEENMCWLSSVQEALKAAMEKSGDNFDQSSSGNVKRQRINSVIN